jgi:NitT/TauT family transport system substrate-binding protein
MRTRHGRARCRPGLLSIAVGVLLVACSAASTPPPAPAAGAARPDTSAPAGTGAGAGAGAGSTAGSTGPAAAAPAAPAPPEPIPLRVAVQGRPDQAHFTLALERGYFAQEGLAVETVQIGSGAEMVPALATNQVQVGNGAPSAALYNALARDVNIRMVADWAHVGTATDSTLAILARKDLYDSGAVRSMADLKGRSFANGTVPGTVSDLLFYRALAKEGVSSDGIDKQYMPFPDILSALGNAKLGGGTMTEPLVTQASHQGFAEVLYPAGAVIPGAILSVLQYSPQFGAEQPDAAIRFMVGYLRGVRDYYDAFHLKQNREAAIDLLVQHLSVKDPVVWQTYSPSFTDLNGRVDVDDLKDSAAFYAQNGMLNGPAPDVTQFVDQQFADAAVQRLGRR